MLFLDFKKVYDSIQRATLVETLKEFQFPSKLIRLIEMSGEQTLCQVETIEGNSDRIQS